MVQVGVALIATLVALAGTGVLLSRAFDRRRPHLFAWALTQVGLCVSLGATTIGLMVNFSEPLFRATALGGALIAPLWLAMGVIELVTRPVPVKFVARLVVVSYSIVAVVILALDPLRGTFSTTLPKLDDHYEWLPQAVLAGADLIAVATLVVCAAVTALQARDMQPGGQPAGQSAGQPVGQNVLVPVAFIALAGALVVSGTRGYLPAAAAVFALGAAAGLVWFGAIKTIPVRSEDDDAYDDGYDDGYDGYNAAYDGRPQGDQAGQAGGYGDYDDDPRARHRRRPSESLAEQVAGAMAASAPLSAPVPSMSSAPPAPPASSIGAASSMGAAPEIPAGAYGQITVYTLLDGRESAFDRLSREAVRAARQGDPGTLIYACHEVVGAPTQRIFYQLFRDQAAFTEHQNRPYVRQFLADSRSHVIATNVIELRLDTAKVMPAATPPTGPGGPTGPELQMGRPWGP